MDLEPDSDSKSVLLEGFVKKRSTLYFYKKRYLELSILKGKPRLLYYYQNQKKLRNEIPLDRNTKVLMSEPGKFEIRGDHETLYFKEPGSKTSCEDWVDQISECVHSIKLNAKRRHH